MIIPKLLILAESENWIVVTDRKVNKCALFDSYNGRGKVTIVIFPLFVTDEKVKGVVFVAFGKSHHEHKGMDLPECLHFGWNCSTVGKIAELYRDYRFAAAGCYFVMKNVTYLSECESSSFNTHEVTFADSSGSFGAYLLGFDVRRLLRVWFQDLFKWTRRSLDDTPKEEKSNKMKEILVELKADTEYCLEFMSLDPQVVLKTWKGKDTDMFRAIARAAFGLIP